MKKLANLVLIVLTLAALGWALWRGFHLRHEESPEAAAETPPEDAAEEHEDFTVTLEKEKWKAMGFEMGEPEKAEFSPRQMAFGRVLDPSPLIQMEGDIATAEAALAASKAEFDRSQKLLTAGENTSRKAVETAEAQFRADELKVAGLQRSRQLQWGEILASLDAPKRRVFVEQLVQGGAALVRVELASGEAPRERPRHARLILLGREQTPLEAAAVFSATSADPRSQAEGYLLRVDKPPFPLRPGMAATAWLESSEKPRGGFIVPRAAVLRHDGRPWVFVQEEEEKFVRKPVTLEAPVEGERGWFVSGDGSIKGEDLIVIVGGQVLLSAELRAASGAAEEE